MEAIKTQGFDAVAESCRWKEAVARQTESLDRDATLAFFDKKALLTVLQNMRESAPQSAMVREEPPTA